MKILLRASIFAVLAALLIAPIRVFADEGSESLQVPNPYVCISSYSMRTRPEGRFRIVLRWSGKRQSSCGRI
jgi:hypothetical protein